MGKTDAEVIALFNEQVNMTADELETWLDDPQSREAGTGVGIESGRRIVEILRKNPDKKPDGYDEEDLAHIRKVVSYNSRHLAQEDHLKDKKTTEELEKAKSTISLKNWGHDPVKVKLQREAERSSNDGTNSIGDRGDSSGGSSGAEGGSASPDQERDLNSDADADGEADTQASSGSRNDDTDSDSDPFEDAEPGRKRALRGPPAGAEHRGYGGRHAGGDADAGGTGVGRNKRIHRDQKDLDEQV